MNLVDESDHWYNDIINTATVGGRIRNFLRLVLLQEKLFVLANLAQYLETFPGLKSNVPFEDYKKGPYEIGLTKLYVILNHYTFRDFLSKHVKPSVIFKCFFFFYALSDN